MQERYREKLLLVARVVFGLLFLYSGTNKLMSGFSAENFLVNSSSFFQTLAGNQVVDLLVVWGEILIGVSLISGTLVKVAAIAGSLMMVLFYLASFPPEQGYISQHIIYILLFLILGAFDAGGFLGGDEVLRSKLNRSTG